MDCGEVRLELVDVVRGRLPGATLEGVERHLRGCKACRRALEAERALEALLASGLPRPSAPPGLEARLAGLAAPAAAVAGLPLRSPRRRRPNLAALAAVAATLALAASALLVGRHLGADGAAEAALTDDLVDDHLRVLASQRPAEIEGGGSHQVKPWFEGRLDFAPVVPEPGPGMALSGGAVGYVRGQRAAVLEYTLRLHRLTLLVVRAEAARWPAGAAATASTRGFSVVRWRAGDLGYALVGDVAREELDRVAAAFRSATGG